MACSGIRADPKRTNFVGEVQPNSPAALGQLQIQRPDRRGQRHPGHRLRVA